VKPFLYDAVMADGNPPGNHFGGDGSFDGMEMLNELMRMMGSPSTGVTESARRLAHSIATDGQSEPNTDPTDRLGVEELVRVAELQLAAVTELPTVGSVTRRVEVVNRSQWADQTIADYRPIIETLSEAMTANLPFDQDTDDDPITSMMAGFGNVMGPMMLGMTMGSMIGSLARGSLGGFDLPVPRQPNAPLLVLLRNVDDFGEQWSLNPTDLRLWVCLHEVTSAAVLSVAHVRDRLTDLLLRHAAEFSPDLDRVMEQFGELNLANQPDEFDRLQSTLNNPELLLGAVRSPSQDALQPELTALVAAVTGYVDWVMDTIGSNLISSYPMMTEALRRQRVEANAGDRFIERILGLELDAAQYDRGAAFAAGVVERAGRSGLHRLFEDAANLPTPAEVDAPGLWLARIDLPS